MSNIDKLLGLITEEDSAIYITSDSNRFYFTNFRSSAGVVYATKKQVYLLVDFRYYEAAKNKVSKEIVVLQYTKIFETVNNINKELGINSIILEDDNVTLSMYRSLKEAYNVNIISDFNLSDKLLNIRMVKSDDEILKLKEAHKITEKAYLETLNVIKPGMTEKEVSAYLEYLMKRNGAEKVSFELITISGKNTSLPHGVPSNNIIKEGDFFTFDIGAVFDGYCSDMTRTIAIKSCSDRQREIYNIVLEAHMRAYNEIIAGNKVKNVDLAARSYIEAKGYGDCFGHSTGHGVGIDIHEKPTVYKTNETILMPNMVITDEPGIYIENEFGVRIEDMYLVTDKKAISFASIEKKLLVV